MPRRLWALWPTHRPLRRLLIILGSLVLGLLVYVLLRTSVFRPEWETRYPNLVTVLLVAQDEEGKPASSYVVFLHPERGYLHLYRVNPEVSFKRWWGSQEKITEKSIGAALNLLEKTLKVPIPYYMVFRDEGLDHLVDRLGGLPGFNDSSEPFQKGEVVLSSESLDDFYEGLGRGPQVRQDTAVHLWLNAIWRGLNQWGRWPDADEGAAILWKAVDDTNMPKRLFYHLIGLMAKKNRTLYLSMSRMNVEESPGAKGAITPLEAGRFDSDKLRMLLGRFEGEDRAIRVFPLSVQVLNATEVPRLAAKTAGILRLKKCDVREYLNTRNRLKHSVLICRSGSAAQRDYMQKVTRIDRIYYDVDWRDAFDFTVVLGEDYYAIPYLTNRVE